MNAATQGDEAIKRSDWPSAIEHFTNALIQLPRAPGYYVKRSTAYSRRKPDDGGPDFRAALRDAEIALVLARERAKRELILDAQMRRAVTLFQLERYGDAAFIFDILQSKIGGGQPKDKSTQVQAVMGQQSLKKHEQELSIWTIKVERKLNQVGKDSEKAIVAVKEYPEDLKVPEEEELKKLLEAQLAGADSVSGVVEDVSDEKDQTPPADKTKESRLDLSGPNSAAPMTAGPGAPTVSRIRHEWYQSRESVGVTLYAKSVPKDKLKVDMQSSSLSLEFPLPSGSTFAFTLDPLYAPIDTTQSSISVLDSKVEIILRKQQAGQKWGALEASSTSSVSSDPSTTTNKAAPSTAAPPVTSTSAQTGGPAYPTSSRHGVKDWDKLASNLTSKKKDKAKNQDKDAENSEAESVDSDFGGGDAVDSFFKKIYAKSDPDTRRAMVKSYYESEGTTLSTNWNEVSKGKVVAKPPTSD